MRKLHLFFLFFFFTSCSNIDFVYKDKVNLVNPLYEKTKVSTSGLDISFINSYIPMFFGENKENDFNLLINIAESKTRRSVETNQVTSNLRYEVMFYYTLRSNDKDCITYEKEISSNFTIIPKSSGYNYGTDSSLEKKYELAITENLNRFVSMLSDINVYSCL